MCGLGYHSVYVFLQNHVFLQRKGRWSDEENDLLQKLYDEHGNKWALIGSKIGRSAWEVRDRYRCLLNHEHNRGKWTAEESLRLAKIINVLHPSENGPPTGGILWSQVTRLMKTRNHYQCKAHFITLHNRLTAKLGSEWNAEDDANLIQKLAALGAETVSDVNWSHLSSKWPGEKIRTRWKSLTRRVPNYMNLSFSQQVSFLNDAVQQGQKDLEMLKKSVAETSVSAE